MKKASVIIKTTLILFLITSVSALLLAFVNDKTAPIIAVNESINRQNALKKVINAETFEDIELTDDLKSIAKKYGCELNGVYSAKDADGKSVGICSILSGSGYDSGLQIAVGADSEQKASGIEIISSNETPGLGQNASKPAFREQFIGKKAGIGVVKSGADDTQINALSGATLTSNGVTRIVNAALEIAQKEAE